jgi:hypothetical protein
VDYAQFFYPITPPLFALVQAVLSTGQEQYFGSQARALCTDIIGLPAVYTKAYQGENPAPRVTTCISYITQFGVSGLH